MAKRLVALFAVAAPVLAVGGVAFAQLASHSAVTAVSAAYAGAAVSHDIRTADNLALPAPAAPDLAALALPAPVDLAAPSVAAVDANLSQPQAFRLALLQAAAQTTDNSTAAGSTDAEQSEAKALAQKINDDLAALPPTATQEQVNAVLAKDLSGVTDAVVITAALTVVQQKDNSQAVTTAVATVKSSPAVQAVLATLTPAQQTVATAIVNTVAPSVSPVALAFNSAGPTGTTSGGSTVLSQTGPTTSTLSNTSSTYTGA